MPKYIFNIILFLGLFNKMHNVVNFNNNKETFVNLKNTNLTSSHFVEQYFFSCLNISGLSEVLTP